MSVQAVALGVTDRRQPAPQLLDRDAGPVLADGQAQAAGRHGEGERNGPRSRVPFHVGEHHVDHLRDQALNGDGLPAHDFAICAPEPGAIPTTSGFTVQVEHGLDRLADADLVAVPAWPQLDAPVHAPLVTALREAAGRGARVLTVCTGAFLPAAAGLLDGRRATTHWRFAELLSRRHPRVRVEPDILYVEDGPVLSSAGAAAGIDAWLHLIRLEYGAATANALARRLVVPAHRAGGQAQYVEAPMSASRAPYELAELLERRLQLAEELLETTDLSVDAVAVRVGFGGADTLRHHFAARCGVAPATYRRAFRRDP
ncbi:helix-turn-helix domain-containing protein [Nonomuraea sp. NPDC050783]|uniref:helix-turn-helix domain-containing protein n=1 Tax=Nonomuraea sp. NPDC050783 TaxID=3154634 RepID=UPI0034672D94